MRQQILEAEYTEHVDAVRGLQAVMVAHSEDAGAAAESLQAKEQHVVELLLLEEEGTARCRILEEQYLDLLEIQRGSSVELGEYHAVVDAEQRDELDRVQAQHAASETELQETLQRGELIAEEYRCRHGLGMEWVTLQHSAAVSEHARQGELREALFNRLQEVVDAQRDNAARLQEEIQDKDEARVSAAFKLEELGQRLLQAGEEKTKMDAEYGELRSRLAMVQDEYCSLVEKLGVWHHEGVTCALQQRTESAALDGHAVEDSVSSEADVASPSVNQGMQRQLTRPQVVGLCLALCAPCAP